MTSRRENRSGTLPLKRLPHHADVRQDLIAPAEFKSQFGDVRTPFSLINAMLDDLPAEVWRRDDYTWLDPCVGRGYYLMAIYDRLMRGLAALPRWADERERSAHIVGRMLFGCDINPVNVAAARSHFSQYGHRPNIAQMDFLEGDVVELNWPALYSMVVANPPYNAGGRKKVPTAAGADKRADGRTVWCDFVSQSLACLARSRPQRPTFLSMIVPSIWLKPDRAKIYELLTSRADLKIRCFSNTATNQIFSRQAQTPTCYFSLRGATERERARAGAATLQLYDDVLERYIRYPFRQGEPIPCAFPALMASLRAYARARPSLPELSLYTRKTMMPRRGVVLSPKYVRTPERARTDLASARALGLSPNIRTCVLERKSAPRLVCQNSSEDCVGAGEEKLVLAHKMYGFPYYDGEGVWGVSTRDNYILRYRGPDSGASDSGYDGDSSSDGGGSDGEKEDDRGGERTRQGPTRREWYQFQRDFLSTPLARCMFESTRYRMCYLEKYVFELIPDMALDPEVLDFWRERVHIPDSENELNRELYTKETGGDSGEHDAVRYQLLMAFSSFLISRLGGYAEEPRYSAAVLSYDPVPYTSVRP
jgi:hypothetical protein